MSTNSTPAYRDESSVHCEQTPRTAALADASRATDHELQSQAAHFDGSAPAAEILSVVPNPIAVLNAQRQIVFANPALAALTGAEQSTDLIGQRPGEVLRCVHATDHEDGCGATAYCLHCGAAKAITGAQQGRPSVQECRIMRDASEAPAALDLRVWARPHQIQHQTFTILAMEDISDEKRRETLERIFFHDVLNTVQKIQSAVELLDGANDRQASRLLAILNQSVHRLATEIETQRDLLAMENKTLELQPSPISAHGLLEELLRSYENERAAGGTGLPLARSSLRLADDSQDVTFIGDRGKLQRVLDNMIKNALEAERTGGVVTVGCRRLDLAAGKEYQRGDMVEFWVHNPTVMTTAVQRQVFQRSFSTKGGGRGLGTYSMKMLTEHYLEGWIDFSSEPGDGTVFRVRYPLRPTYV